MNTKGEKSVAAGISLRVGWMLEPLMRVGVEFERIEKWLTKNNLFSWEAIDHTARFFHPDYIYDSKTRAVIPDRLKGAAIYQMMECGEFNIKLIAAAAPLMRKSLPVKFRRMPVEHLWNVLGISARLAMHEYEQIKKTLAENPRNEETLARHLYWFTRFSALWHRTHAAPPPNLKLTTKKRTDAATWQENLRNHCQSYRARHPNAAIQRIVIDYLKPKGKDHPSFGRRYRWALKHLK